jgi:predicted enzyme related to lactoylglutathione lyase
MIRGITKEKEDWIMSEVNEYKPGTFCWVDLGTTDANGAKTFYGDLLGWSFEDRPAGPDAVYTMLKLEGKEVAGLYQLGEDMTSQGVPSHWLSYVSVASADDTAKRVKELGGTVLKEPFDVFDVGRMAVVQDPTGAVFAIWQPKKHCGARLINQPGAFCWNELLTVNVDRAGKFYTDLFGWSTQTQDMGPMTYTSFMNGDRPAGGMMPIGKEMGQVPPHWSVYFSVNDCDKAVEKAKSLAAKILVPPTDIPGVGRFAVLHDPQGAAVALIKLDNPA